MLDGFIWPYGCRVWDVFGFGVVYLRLPGFRIDDPAICDLIGRKKNQTQP